MTFPDTQTPAPRSTVDARGFNIAEKRQEALSRGQREILEMIATGRALPDVLGSLVLLIESLTSGMIGSIVVLDDSGQIFQEIVAPGLPDSYTAALLGLRIGPDTGSCGTAAFRAERVVVEDVATHPLWAEYGDLALRHGLRACWSSPILDSSLRVLGTFALYYREPRLPEIAELDLVDVATHLAAIAIARHQAEARLLRQNRLYAVLSGISAAIVRFRQPETLYAETCRIVVENGQMALASVGLPDAASQRLVPIARWGRDTDCLDLFPTDAAVAMSIGSFSNDLERDPRIEPWHAPARDHGFRSAASFPIKVAGRPTAVLAVYADLPGYFGEDELSMFHALVDDLGFALEAAQQEALRQQAYAQLQTIRLAVENATDGIGIIDADGRSIYQNHTLTNGLGYTCEEAHAAGGVLALAFDQKRVAAIWEVVRARGSWTGNVKLYNRQRDVLEFYLRVDSVTDDAGHVIAFIGVFTELGERKRNAQKIAQQAALLDKAQDAIIERDMHDVILYWNKGAERIYGWTQEEAQGRALGELLQQEAAESLTTEAALLKDGEWHGDLRYVSKDGNPLLVEGRWTLVRDEEGGPSSVLAIHTDITEKRRLETQFLRAQRMESIGTLASGVAHDLNNILSPILMSLGVLRMRLPAPADRSLLDTLELSANRGAAIIKQILTFARGVEGQRLPIVTRTLLAEVEGMARETFPKSIQIRCDVIDEAWNLRGDPTQLHQVLLNLAVNARDAMPHGGQLTLSARNVSLDAHFASMNPEARPGRHLLIEVSDTGTGIPAAIRERIYEPFFTTKEPGHGTGLGLSTTLAIVKSHGGFIDLANPQGKGSTFRIYLPAADDQSAQANTELVPPKLLHGHGELILIIDDEAPIRKITAQTLEAFGYRTITASDGAEGIALYARQRHEIAAVLTDLMMPVMDGPATIQALRSLTPELVIIACTGLSGDLRANKLAAAAVQHFLPKPYTAEVILKVLHQALASSSGRAPRDFLVG